MKKALVFGGTGFLGKHLVISLCKHNFQVVLVSRNRRKFETLKTMAFPGQITWKRYDVTSSTFLKDFILEPFDIVINLIGIWEEKKSNLYQSVHAIFPLQLASLCKKYEKNLIHVSGFFPQTEKNNMLKLVKTKQDGETAIQKHVPKAIIIRPTFMIGENDILLSHFERLSRFPLPFIAPFIFKKKQIIRPLCVEDAAAFINECAINPELNGKVYTLLGLEAWNFIEMAKKIASHIKKRKIFISVPKFLFLLFTCFRNLIPIGNKILPTKDFIAATTRASGECPNNLQLIVKNPISFSQALNKVFQKYELYD